MLATVWHQTTESVRAHTSRSSPRRRRRNPLRAVVAALVETLEARQLLSSAPLPLGATATALSFSSSGSLAIPASANSVTSTIAVAMPGASYLWDIDLGTQITHTSCGDLTVTLTSPQGITTTIVSNTGGGRDNLFNGTTWDDQAGTPITDATFTSGQAVPSAVPEGALGAFIGEDPNGLWTLTVTNKGTVGGTVGSWSLTATALPTAPPYLASTSASNTTAQAIPDATTDGITVTPSMVTSTIDVSGMSPTLSKVKLTTLITHASNGDLDILLTSPSGTVVSISTGNAPGKKNVFNGTVWDDQATTPATDYAYVSNQLAPSLIPEGALAAFNGENPNGTWTLTIRDTKANGSAGTLNGWTLDLTSAASAAAPPAFDSYALSPASISEGSSTTFSGVITDPLPGLDHSVVIDWGDGTISTSSVSGGTATFSSDHVYLDDNAADLYDISAHITDASGRTSDAATTSITVTNVPPVISSASFPTVDEGTSAKLAGTFSDPGTLDTFSLVVDWGDGTALGTYSVAAGKTTFPAAATHKYKDNGNYNIAFTLADDDGGAASGAATATVNNVAPTASNVSASSINEGDRSHLTGTIVDPGTKDSFTLTVDWGDGTTPTAYGIGAGATSFDVSHKYVDDDPSGTSADTYNIGYTLTDKDGGSFAGTSSATVSNVAPIISDLAATPVDEGGTSDLTGTITDPGVKDTFTLVVDWGDGSALGTYSIAAGKTSFDRTHKYRDNPNGQAFGTYNISVTLTDDDGGVGTASTTVLVSNVAPTASFTGPTSGVRGQTRSFVGSFTDPGTDTHKVSWNFGDGTVIPMHSSTDDGALTPDHVFASAGTFTVTLTVRDGDGAIGTFSQSITISVAQLQPDPGNPTLQALFVGGTTGDDYVYMSAVKKPANGVNVYINNTLIGTFVTTGRVVVFGQAGNDELDGVSGRINMLFGGDGNDQLQGGTVNDVLVAGPGMDQLAGGNGLDILIGGADVDTLEGDAGADILIAGATAYDNDIGALCAIQAEWSRTTVKYADRVAHLRGTGTGGVNGSTLLDSAHLIADTGGNFAQGNADTDLFFADQVADTLDRRTTENLFPLE